MKAALEEMKGANGNEELGEKDDLQFHLTNTEAGGNPLLMSLMNHVSGLMGESMRETRKVWLFSKQTTLERLYEEHLAIYRSIENQEEEKAKHYMSIYLDNVENLLKQYFQNAN